MASDPKRSIRMQMFVRRAGRMGCAMFRGPRRHVPLKEMLANRRERKSSLWYDPEIGAGDWFYGSDHWFYGRHNEGRG